MSNMGAMRRTLTWMAALLSVTAVQVLLGRWAYAAYKYPCNSVPADARATCAEYNGQSTLLLFPVGGIIAVWFVVDLALLVLGLWLFARHDARRGAGWRRGALRVGMPLSAALAVHMLLGYWWVMAFTQGPHQSTPGECPNCFRLALKEENALEAVNSGVVFLVWACVDVALVWFGIWLLRRRRSAPTRPSLFEDAW